MSVAAVMAGLFLAACGLALLRFVEVVIADGPDGRHPQVVAWVIAMRALCVCVNACGLACLARGLGVV